MTATQQTNKRERTEARVTVQQKALLQRAADIRGRGLPEFIISSAEAMAEETIRTYEVITLNAQDNLAFVDAVLRPPAPNDALRAAARRYKEITGLGE